MQRTSLAESRRRWSKELFQSSGTWLPDTSMNMTTISFYLWQSSGMRLQPVERDLYKPCLVRNVSHFNSNITDVDLEKENAMKYRTVYDHADWRRHRSGWRYIGHLASKPSTRVIRALGTPVLSLTSVATLIVGYNEAVTAQRMLSWMPVFYWSPLPLSLTYTCLFFVPCVPIQGSMKLERRGE